MHAGIYVLFARFYLLLIMFLWVFFDSFKWVFSIWGILIWLQDCVVSTYVEHTSFCTCLYWYGTLVIVELV